MLSYSLVFTPDLSKKIDFNPVCSDKRIHIRFRDFDKPQVISGFEKKLTYLITYLMNYSYIANLMDIEQCKDEKFLVDALLNSKDVKTLYQFLRTDMQIDFKGFKITPNYNKREKTIAFGKLEQTAFPLNYDAFGNVKTADMNSFFEKLKIELPDYLFNDAYVIVLQELDTKNTNLKFINKEMRKVNRSNNDFVTL